MAFGVDDPWATPAVVEADHSSAGPVLLALGAWALGAVGPVWSTAFGVPRHGADALRLAVIALLWAALLRIPITRRWVGLPLLAAAAAGGVLAGSTSEGHAPAALALLGVLAVDAALSPPARVPGWPPRRPGTASLALPLVIVAELTWVRRLDRFTTGALLLAALAVVEVYRWAPDRVAPLDRVVARAVGRLTRVVAAVVVLAAAIPTLYLPGLVATLYRRVRARSPGWRSCEESLADQRRDAPYPFATTPPAARRHRYRVAVLVIVLLVPLTIAARDRLGGGSGGGRSAGRPIEYSSFAFRDAPWVDELYAAGWPEQYHPSLGWKSADVSSRYLNVTDGVRRSWEPDHPRFVVWFFGGSALYGLGQRDDHTIPSEVARLSASTSTPIEAVNLGAPGYDQWQEVASMSYRLSRGERPDLIVFYDGANDLTAMQYRASQGIVPLDEPPNRFQRDLEDQYPQETRAGHPASRAQLLNAFTDVYVAGIDQATRTAGAYGVPATFYWQPEYYSTKPSKVDAPLLQAFPELRSPTIAPDRALRSAVRSRLPATVVDLGSALDGVGRPTFFDYVHTNELGAKIVATKLWPSLRARLGAVRTGTSPPG